MSLVNDGLGVSAAMNDRHFSSVIAILLAASSCVVAQENARGTIRFLRADEALFLNCVDVASALRLDAKIVTPDRLLTFCREGDAGYCIPVQLTPANHRGDNGSLMLDAALVSRALSCRITANGDEITIEKLADFGSSDAGPATKGYNVEWPAGRGFRVGETLPDIPLVNLKGDEVRFSQFLGKRYILYCWASW